MSSVQNTLRQRTKEPAPPLEASYQDEELRQKREEEVVWGKTPSGEGS